MQTGTSLAGAQWLRLHALSAGGPGLIPSQGTKILNASLWGLKNRIPQTDHVTLFRETIQWRSLRTLRIILSVLRQHRKLLNRLVVARMEGGGGG